MFGERRASNKHAHDVGMSCRSNRTKATNISVIVSHERPYVFTVHVVKLVWRVHGPTAQKIFEGLLDVEITIGWLHEATFAAAIDVLLKDLGDKNSLL